MRAHFALHYRPDLAERMAKLFAAYRARHGEEAAEAAILRALLAKALEAELGPDELDDLHTRILSDPCRPGNRGKDKDARKPYAARKTAPATRRRAPR